MISASDTNIESVLPFFAERGIDVALIVPTQTGLQKSIMDATAPIRQFLKRNNIHDFETQNQGPEFKRSIPTHFVYPDHLRETTTSLYRPLTKKGDSRIWFCKMDDFCIASNLLAITACDGVLYILNLSNKETFASLRGEGSVFLCDLIDSLAIRARSSATELLEKLVAIHKLGFIKSCVRGDTGVGMTLEQQLGIAPNSDKRPDYKGIELKASRGVVGERSRNRANLFSQTPDWQNSTMTSAQELLDAFGYYRGGRKQLYCTVEAGKPNTQGLYFFVDEEADLLENRARTPDENYRKVVQWQLDTLRKRLSEKHKETFWVKAASMFQDGEEFFRYDQVVYTKAPNIGLLSTLLSQRIITMDYTLSQLPNRVRDHGYLFKIRPENLGLLFPPPQTFILSNPIYTKAAEIAY